ncbi:MAG: FAD-binding oxidoreductase, partial [Lentisphaeria bacterium]
MEKFIDNSTIISNSNLIGDYFIIEFTAPKTATHAKPGQFVHLQIPFFAHRILRRPFSIYNTNPQKGTVSVVYKVVGEGTKQLSQVPANTQFS